MGSGEEEGVELKERILGYLGVEGGEGRVESLKQVEKASTKRRRRRLGADMEVGKILLGKKILFTSLRYY